MTPTVAEAVVLQRKKIFNVAGRGSIIIFPLSTFYSPVGGRREGGGEVSVSAVDAIELSNVVTFKLEWYALEDQTRDAAAGRINKCTLRRFLLFEKISFIFLFLFIFLFYFLII